MEPFEKLRGKKLNINLHISFNLYPFCYNEHLCVFIAHSSTTCLIVYIRFF